MRNTHSPWNGGTAGMGVTGRWTADRCQAAKCPGPQATSPLPPLPPSPIYAGATLHNRTIQSWARETLEHLAQCERSWGFWP
eukprot:365970-Chlamydomonas_euryale.AAC.9